MVAEARGKCLALHINREVNQNDQGIFGASTVESARSIPALVEPLPHGHHPAREVGLPQPNLDCSHRTSPVSCCGGGPAFSSARDRSLFRIGVAGLTANAGGRQGRGGRRIRRHPDPMAVAVPTSATTETAALDHLVSANVSTGSCLCSINRTSPTAEPIFRWLAGAAADGDPKGPSQLVRAPPSARITALTTGSFGTSLRFGSCGTASLVSRRHPVVFIA